MDNFITQFMDALGFDWTEKFMQAIEELKGIDTILTEISKTSDRTQKSLEHLGETAVDSASKYGMTISGYLNAVQEMSNAGFDNRQSEQFAELSILAQSSGSLQPDTANEYLIASNEAYNYAGNVQKLNDLLDGQNQVANRNAVSMEDLANATKTAAGQLSDLGIKENELTALLGTGIKASHAAGETAGHAVESIIMNLRQAEGETGFDGEVIDEESLKRVESRCLSVGVALKSVKDGITTLRDPMEILKELARVYNSLPDHSADKAGIISDIGGEHSGDVLSGILSNWDLYERMLSDYENSEGSALQDATKTADSWEGLLTQISNNWTGFVQNFANDSLVTNTLKFVNELIKGVDRFAEAFGALPTLMAAIGAGLGAKNVGNRKMFRFINMPNIGCVLLGY